MMRQYEREFPLPYPDAGGREPLGNLERVLRLAPQWDVKAFSRDGASFTAALFHDRLERDFEARGVVDVDNPERELAFTLTLPGSTLRFRAVVDNPGPRGRAVIRVHADPDPVVQELREYDMWARSIVNYMSIGRSRSPLTRAWKWFLDRWWLTMAQSGKRIALFVVMGEGVALAFFLVILLWWKFFS